MINESNQIFGVPEALATDIHAYWEDKRKNAFVSYSPLNFNSSVNSLYFTKTRNPLWYHKGYGHLRLRVTEILNTKCEISRKGSPFMKNIGFNLFINF